MEWTGLPDGKLDTLIPQGQRTARPSQARCHGPCPATHPTNKPIHRLHELDCRQDDSLDCPTYICKLLPAHDVTGGGYNHLVHAATSHATLRHPCQLHSQTPPTAVVKGRPIGLFHGQLPNHATEQSHGSAQLPRCCSTRHPEKKQQTVATTPFRPMPRPTFVP